MIGDAKGLSWTYKLKICIYTDPNTIQYGFQSLDSISEYFVSNMFMLCK